MTGSGRASAPAGPYRLETPKTVLKSTFTESDHSAPDQDTPLMLSDQIEHGVSAFASYQPADRTSETSGPVLAVTGVYGTVLSPVTARDEFLKILDRRTSGDPDMRSVYSGGLTECADQCARVVGVEADGVGFCRCAERAGEGEWPVQLQGH